MEDNRFKTVDKDTQIGIIIRQTNYNWDEIDRKFDVPEATYTSIISEYLNISKDVSVTKCSNNQQRYREYGKFLKVENIKK